MDRAHKLKEWRLTEFKRNNSDILEPSKEFVCNIPQLHQEHSNQQMTGDSFPGVQHWDTDALSSNSSIPKITNCKSRQPNVRPLPIKRKHSDEIILVESNGNYKPSTTEKKTKRYDLSEDHKPSEQQSNITDEREASDIVAVNNKKNSATPNNHETLEYVNGTDSDSDLSLFELSVDHSNDRENSQNYSEEKKVDCFTLRHRLDEIGSLSHLNRKSSSDVNNCDSVPRNSPVELDGKTNALICQPTDDILDIDNHNDVQVVEQVPLISKKGKQPANKSKKVYAKTSQPKRRNVTEDSIEVVEIASDEQMPVQNSRNIQKNLVGKSIAPTSAVGESSRDNPVVINDQEDILTPQLLSRTTVRNEVGSGHFSTGPRRRRSFRQTDPNNPFGDLTDSVEHDDDIIMIRIDDRRRQEMADLEYARMLQAQFDQDIVTQNSDRPNSLPLTSEPDPTPAAVRQLSSSPGFSMGRRSGYNQSESSTLFNRGTQVLVRFPSRPSHTRTGPAEWERRFRSRPATDHRSSHIPAASPQVVSSGSPQSESPTSSNDGNDRGYQFSELADSYTFGGIQSYEEMLELADRVGAARQAGMTKAQIGLLPTRTYMTESDLPDVSQRDCNICLNPFRIKDKLRTLPCFHGYHSKCVDTWLKTSATCPVCRAHVNI